MSKRFAAVTLVVGILLSTSVWLVAGALRVSDVPTAAKTERFSLSSDQLQAVCMQDWVRTYPSGVHPSPGPDYGLATLPSCERLDTAQVKQVQIDLLRYLTAQ